MISGPGASTAIFRDLGHSSGNRCFPINFLLRVDDFQDWRLHGHIPGSGHLCWDRCFPFDFLLRNNNFRACSSTAIFRDLGTPPGIIVFLLTSFQESMISGRGATAIFQDLGNPFGIVVFLLTSFEESMISGPGASAAISRDLGIPAGIAVSRRLPIKNR